MGKFYAVAAGRKTGILHSWDECNASINGYKGAKFHAFKSEDEALEWLEKAMDEVLNTKTIEQLLKEAENPVMPFAFTDGSYNQKSGALGSAFVMQYEDNEGVHTVMCGDRYEDFWAAKMRNVFSELEAVKKAVNRAEELNLPVLNVYHDYNGVGLWADGIWSTSLPYVKEWIEWIREVRKTMTINFFLVPGHYGNKWNEQADELAKQACM